MLFSQQCIGSRCSGSMSNLLLTYAMIISLKVLCLYGFLPYFIPWNSRKVSNPSAAGVSPQVCSWKKCSCCVFFLLLLDFSTF